MDMEEKQEELIDHFVNRASSLTAAASSSSSLASLVSDATSHPSLFAFSEILSLPSLLQLEGTENSVYLDVLRLFAHGTWSDYKSNAGRLPQLVPEQALKLKQLTVLTLAETNKGESECSYYLKTGQCNYGLTCKFHHPQPAGTSIPASAPQFYPSVQSPSIPMPEQFGGQSAGVRVARPPLVPDSYVKDDRELIRMFLKNNASQLTFYGLFCLQDGLKERELCVFFHNNHFSTMFKFNGELYLLATDQGYLNQQDLVWEKLNEVNGDTLLMTGNFKEFKFENQSNENWDENNVVTSTADYLASIDSNSASAGIEMNSDLQLAIALQQQEFEEQPQHQQQRPNVQQPSVSGNSRMVKI